MKLLVLSDLHGNNKMTDKMDELFSKADAVLFGGDFAECFKPETGSETLKKLCTKHESIFAVLGNCDNETFMDDLEEQDVCVEKTLVYHEGIAICGAGGGTFFTGKTEFERTEDEILADLKIVENAVEQSGDESLWENLIIICHNPPKSEICDKVNDTLHAGSLMFTDYIKEKQPLAVICGHIHEGKGYEKIGKTTVINPGAMQEGNYAWLTISRQGDSWKVDSVEMGKIE